MENLVSITCLGIIIPTIILLYSLVHAAFIIGEYKTNEKELPYVMLLSFVKLFTNIVTLIFAYITMFDFEITDISLSTLILISCGALICFDTILTNKFAYKIFKYDGKEKFEYFLYKECENIRQHHKILLYAKEITMVIFTVLCMLILFIKVFNSIYLIILFYCLFIVVDNKIVTYIKSIKNG